MIITTPKRDFNWNINKSTGRMTYFLEIVPVAAEVDGCGVDGFSSSLSLMVITDTAGEGVSFIVIVC